jgi:leucyl-tRNA synthetase
MSANYRPTEIEPKWQKIWEETGLYRTQETAGRPKFYCLDFFPYPSGEGLHVGHCRNYVPTDVISRLKRMQGYNVLHPMGWDAFGEPAEQYAIASNVHPRQTTDQNTANYKRQMTAIGASYDWSREIDSSRPEFYRWTQWFFMKMYRRGLAYRDTNWQWWCPVCQTTMSSHEAAGGVCWRGHTGLYRRQIPAWYFRITAYADELISGLDTVDWPESIKSMQRNWIGRSEGCEIVFSTASGEPIPVFTTRPDTLFGVTFIALAPEHSLVATLTTPEQQDTVASYQSAAASLGEVQRMVESREKTGVFTGSYAIHPLSGERIPIWVADYVLPGYGSGAVMGVPAHDVRDFEFARKFDLPVKCVIAPPEYHSEPLAEAYIGSGPMVNSGAYNGMHSLAGSERIAADLEARGLGHRRVQYRMRDWLISRQRYWGTPIPIVHCPQCGEVPVPEDQLPVELPVIDDYRPDGSGRSPLARIPEFVNTTCPKCGGPAQRETDTMGGFACSSWYFLRFTSPHETSAPFDVQAMRYWMPVDLYVGGAEHAVLHLLYARFWTKALADEGLLPFREPFATLKNQGQLLAPDGARMSKSRRNTITPDAMIQQFGADALRVYEMFMAPFDQDIQWNTDGMQGARRFLNRVWNLVHQTYAASQAAQAADTELERLIHRVIRQVTERIEGFRFNTMVSALMEFTNQLVKRQQQAAWQTATFHQALETLMVLLAPAAPYITEELWQQTGHTGSVHQQAWPAWKPALAESESIQIPVQVDGKVREVITISTDAAGEEVEAQVLALTRIQQIVAGRSIKNKVYVPGKIYNIVTKH